MTNIKDPLGKDHTLLLIGCEVVENTTPANGSDNSVCRTIKRLMDFLNFYGAQPKQSGKHWN